MFRIDTDRSGPSRVDVRVSGRLAGEQAAQLCETVEPHLDSPKPVYLDLSGLTGLDQPVLRAIARLAARGVRLVRCPAFLTLWLRADRRSRIREDR